MLIFHSHLFLELFPNYDQLTYKNLLRSEYAVKSLATIIISLDSQRLDEHDVIPVALQPSMRYLWLFI